ncbi:MAG: hypothetical protein JSS50_03020 [Proteobacteria bacterium]|nr:hypothetical protein [Pseudomonadota bacterium]
MKRFQIFTGKNWHFLPVIASVGLIGAGVGMAAGGVPEALMAVGTSNLATVLALSGAALLIPSMLLWHKRSDSSIVTAGQDVAVGVLSLVAVAALIVAGYYATHFHIGSMFSGLGVWESLGAQSLVSFGFGAIIGALYALPFYLKPVPGWSESDFLKSGLSIGLICAATTTVGPILTQVMQAAVAANSPEAIAVETMIAVSIASLAWFSFTVTDKITNQLKALAGKCCSGGKAI